MTRTGMMIGLAVTLSACGGGGGNLAGGTAQNARAAASGDDVLDACAHIDKAAIEQTLRGKIQSTELSAVRDGGQGNGDRFSQCAYNFGGLNILVIGTGISYGNPSVAEQVESMRSEIKMGSNTPTEDVPGIGKAALWNPGLHALYLFPGDKRLLSFTFNKLGEPDQKAAAIKLARKLGG